MQSSSHGLGPPSSGTSHSSRKPTALDATGSNASHTSSRPMGAVGIAPRTTLGPRLGLPDGEATAPGVFHPPQARRFHCLAAPLRLHDPALLYPRLWVVPIAPPQRVLSKPLGFMCVHVLHPTTLLTPPFRHCPFCGLVFKRALTVGLALFMASRPAFLQHLQRSIASGAPPASRRRAGNQHPSRSIASSVPPTSTRRVPSRVGCPNQHLYSRSIAVCPNPHPSRSTGSGGAARAPPKPVAPLSVE
eukprot:COSAG06_NODE_10843_length_1608_cov_1.278330_1_plen_245_part_10